MRMSRRVSNMCFGIVGGTFSGLGDLFLHICVVIFQRISVAVKLWTTTFIVPLLFAIMTSYTVVCLSISASRKVVA